MSSMPPASSPPPAPAQPPEDTNPFAVERAPAKGMEFAPPEQVMARALAAVTKGAGAVVPFYDFLTSHINGMLQGTSADEAHKQMQALQNEQAGASTVGTLGAMALSAKAAAPAFLQGLSAAQRVAAQVGINAGLYGSGTLAADLLDGSPLSTEKLVHHVGIPALLTAAIGGAVELPGLVGKGAAAVALNRSRRALGLDFTPEAEVVASRALNEGSLSQEGAIEATKKVTSVGEQLSQAAEGIKAPVAVKTRTAMAPPEASAPTPDWLESNAHQVPEPTEPPVYGPAEPVFKEKIRAPITNALRRVAKVDERVPAADRARREILEAAKRIRTPDATFKDVHEIQKSFASAARSEGIEPDSRKLYAMASEALKGHLQQHAPEMGPLAQEYGYYANVAPAAMKAANARMGLKMGGFTVPLPLPNMAQQARGANAVSQGAQSFQDLLDSEVGRLFTDGAQRVVGEFQSDDWKRLETAIKHIQGDPKGASERLHLALGNLPPHVKGPAAAHAIAAADHLAQLHQSTVANPHPPLPGADEWEPSDAAKAQFMDAYRVMCDPTYALRNPSPEGFGVLKAVAPAHLEAFTKAVSSKLAESKNVSYDVKQKVSGVMGMPLDATQMPDFGARQQARMQAYRERKAQMGQQGSARTRASTMKADKASVSRAQRIQSEQEQF